MVDTIETDELGFKTVSVDDEKEIESIYQDLENNKYNLHKNQYVIFEHKILTDRHGFPLTLDCLKWNGKQYERVNPNGFTTQAFGKFKPYDYYQKAAVDSIINNDLTCIKGHAGAGKSLIGLYTAWHLIERGKIDRIIVFTNPVKTKNAEALGFYKGTRTEKLLDSQIGIMLSSKFGGVERVEELIHDGTLTLLPFSDIRGYDTSSEAKTFVWITESQNLDSELLKLGLQRIGDNTKVIVDGDPTTQVDKESYRKNNGMNRMSEVFTGEEYYGEITLKNIYRSKIAKKAQEM
jgi:predicted ribonuclease YlaK